MIQITVEGSLSETKRERTCSCLRIAARRASICCTPSVVFTGLNDRLLKSRANLTSPMQWISHGSFIELTVESSIRSKSSSICKPGGIGVREPCVVDVLS